MNHSSAKSLTPYEQKLKWRKIRIYAVWAITVVACFFLSFHFFDDRFMELIDPQIKQAYTQIAELVPTLKSNEDSVKSAYRLMLNSRNEAAKAGIKLSQDYNAQSQPLEEILDGCFAIDRITQLKVSYNGSVVIVKQEDGQIVAHPVEDQVGKTMFMAPLKSFSDEGITWGSNVSAYKDNQDVTLDSFTDASFVKQLKLKYKLLYAGDNGRLRLKALDSMLMGTIVPYENAYIVCGIGALEYIAYVARAFYISLIAAVILWLFAHYICLTLEQHDQSEKTLRTRLTAYGLLLTIGIFGVSWYIQVLNNVTNNLNTARIYAENGVETLSSYQKTQDRINDWLDEQYLIQCRVASDYVKSMGLNNVTRKDLRDLSEKLGVDHIYIFDKAGKVIVTDSPYDHFVLSNNPLDDSYAFRSLLQGREYIIQQPRPDEISDVRTQFIGVSLRDDNDIANGFVQIDVKPLLRDYLTKPLGVNSVLTNLTVGLPDHALAFDRESLTVSATTGIGYVGESIEDFGYTSDKIKANKSGFLRYQGKDYFAGFSETGDYYLVPLAKRSHDYNAFFTALRIGLIELIGIVLILFMALSHYQSDVVDAAPAVTEGETGPDGKSVSLSDEARRFTEKADVIPLIKKKGFDKRWSKNVSTVQQTPSMRIRAIAYKLMLIFCVINMVPFLYGSLAEGTSNARLTGLAYVLSGNWEKGVNIFAFTSCLFLLFALYVFMSVTNRVLFSIARVSDLRTETICLLLNSSLKYVCVIAFIYYGLSKFGIPTQALLASAGIITLAVSMGAKDLVNDIIAGFFILMEGSLKVGDHVTIGGWSGIVQEIGLRTTRIIRDQETKIINNSSMRDIVNSSLDTTVDTEHDNPSEGKPKAD